MKRLFLLIFFILSSFIARGREYHVFPSGSDAASGTVESPFRTVNHAAQVAMPGDTVTVHSGTYREWIDPLYGGIDDARRILYRAAEGEKVEIKGSEEVRDWKKEKDGTWSTCLPNSMFGSCNPFNEKIVGDWFDPWERDHHTADVYINGLSLYEVTSRDAVAAHETITSRRDPDGSQLVWYAVVDAENTTIYAWFGDRVDPRKENVEVTVRPTCFYPTREGVNYLTIRGFHISQAATQWAAPTAEQIGMVATHWCKGWIIENNHISNSRCNGISLGKEASTGHNLWSQRQFDGATEYIECTLSAVRKGWNRDNVGSHIVRGNEICFCEQTGICGSMGGAFGQIYDNDIHDIWVKCQFDGAEISGIKLHAAIDAYIHNNRIRNCQKGIWMDWMAQGSRISCNLFYDNVQMDIFYEVDHGPFVCDNNICLSEWSLRDWSEGGAFVHNLFNGKVKGVSQERYTPYHLHHSTEVKGLFRICNGDHRFYNNLFSRYNRNDPESGLSSYSEPEWPVFEEDNMECDNPGCSLTEENGTVYLTFKPAEPVCRGRHVDGSRLGVARLSNNPYENPDETPISIDTDYSGNGRSADSPVIGPMEMDSISKVPVWQVK